MTHRRNKTRGFTLTEVLVGLVLLSGMALLVSQILSQASQVVTLSEEKIRQNSAAAALAEAIRDSLRKASPNGILCITEDTDPARRPRLILTTAGVTPSVTTGAKGTGAMTILGLANNQADSSTRLLWMPQCVLFRWPGYTFDPNYDLDPRDFATLQSYTREQVNRLVINTAFSIVPVTDQSVPAARIEEVSRLWQVAATGIRINRLSIQWTDGSRTPPGIGRLIWYGRDLGNTNPGNDPNAQDPVNWNNRGIPETWLASAGSLMAPEYDANPPGRVYRALWTHHNQNNWPKAIRIRFTLTSKDPAMPPEFQNTDYEVIGTVGQ